MQGSRSDNERLEERLGYSFTDPGLLERALTHSSALPELRAAAEEAAPGAEVPQDNERLEFLGDAVLELLASEYLLSNFPDWTEGQLSKSRARMVNARSLESVARRLGLGGFLWLGGGGGETGGRHKPPMLSEPPAGGAAAAFLGG